MRDARSTDSNWREVDQIVQDEQLALELERQHMGSWAVRHLPASFVLTACCVQACGRMPTGASEELRRARDHAAAHASAVRSVEATAALALAEERLAQAAADAALAARLAAEERSQIAAERLHRSDSDADLARRLQREEVARQDREVAAAAKADLLLARRLQKEALAPSHRSQADADEQLAVRLQAMEVTNAVTPAVPPEMLKQDEALAIRMQRQELRRLQAVSSGAGLSRSTSVQAASRSAVASPSPSPPLPPRGASVPGVYPAPLSRSTSSGGPTSSPRHA